MNMQAAPNTPEPDKAWLSGASAWQVLFVQHPLPMWVYDNQSLRFLAVNQAAVDAYGWSEAEFLSLDLMDIRPPEERERLRNHMAVPDGQRRTGLQWLHRKRNG